MASLGGDVSSISPFGRAGSGAVSRVRPDAVAATPSRRARSLLPEFLAALLAVAALGYVAISQGLIDLDELAVMPSLQSAAIVQGEMVSHRFAVCTGPGGTCVIDGDTIRIEGQSIRIADIDTPEVRGYACPAERELGQAATRRMLELVNAGPFELGAYERDTDVYGRKLRILKRDGQSLGMTLVAEGLARPWGGARQSWCG